MHYSIKDMHCSGKSPRITIIMNSLLNPIWAHSFIWDLFGPFMYSGDWLYCCNYLCKLWLTYIHFLGKSPKLVIIMQIPIKSITPIPFWRALYLLEPGWAHLSIIRFLTNGPHMKDGEMPGPSKFTSWRSAARHFS